MEEIKNEVTKQVIFTAPAAWVATMTLILGLSLNEWVAVASITYCILQSSYLAYRWIKEIRSNK